MSNSRAFQQLDPLGALTSQPITLAAAAGLPLFAATMTWFNRFDVDSWPLAVAALLAIAACGATLARFSNPLRAPFTLLKHSIVTGLAVVAYLLSAASMWDTNRYIRDDWGTIAIGVVLLSLSQYRPPKEIASTGLVLALFVGVVALAQAHSFVTGVAPIVYAVVAMAPVLALSLASAGFGRVLVESLDNWRHRAERAASLFTTENSDWVARSVQQDRVTILNQDVVPFFAEVLQRGEITAADRERALAISDAVRAIMVAEADRSWLDIIARQAAGADAEVVDPDRLAPAMSTDQRTALRATIVALCGHPAFDPQGFRAEIQRNGAVCRAVLDLRMSAGDSGIRAEIAPYLAVMRIMFSDVKVELASTTLTLRFSYEQR